jgi:hypothetical protein
MYFIFISVYLGLWFVFAFNAPINSVTFPVVKVFQRLPDMPKSHLAVLRGERTLLEEGKAVGHDNQKFLVGNFGCPLSPSRPFGKFQIAYDIPSPHTKIPVIGTSHTWPVHGDHIRFRGNVITQVNQVGEFFDVGLDALHGIMQLIQGPGWRIKTRGAIDLSQ